MQPSYSVSASEVARVGNNSSKAQSAASISSLSSLSSCLIGFDEVDRQPKNLELFFDGDLSHRHANSERNRPVADLSSNQCCAVGRRGGNLAVYFSSEHTVKHKGLDGR